MNKDQVIFIVGNWMWLIMVVSAVIALVYNVIMAKKEEEK